MVNSSKIDCLRQLLSLVFFNSKFLKGRILKGHLSFDWNYWHISCLPVVSWLPEDGVTHTHHHTTEGPRVWQRNKQIIFFFSFLLKTIQKKRQIDWINNVQITTNNVQIMRNHHSSSHHRGAACLATNKKIKNISKKIQFDNDISTNTQYAMKDER